MCWLICINNKIVIPKHLQHKVLEWYHITLCHPEKTRMELLDSPSLMREIHEEMDDNDPED